MNILLVCGGGITTSMLSAKLQKYAQENGKKDYFSAGRVGQFAELLPHADLVLIAPQAALMSQGLLAEAQRLNIPCRQLNEETFVLGELDKIYTCIEEARTQPGVKAEPVKLTLPLLGQCLMNAALYSFPILLFGLLCRLLYRLSGQDVFWGASRATEALLALYLMFSLGFQYGQVTRRDPVARGLIALGTPLLMLPVDGLVETWNAPFRVAQGHIPLSFFALPNVLFLLVLTVVAVALIYQLDKVRLPASIAAIPMMESMVKMGGVSALFILLRLFLSFL